MHFPLKALPCRFRTVTLCSALGLTAIGAVSICQAQQSIPYVFYPQDSSKYYTDATTSLVPGAPDLHALDATMFDADGDGDLDIAVAVEHGVNRLYLNDGKGKLTWKEGAFGSIAHDSEHVRSADFNRDGLPDLIFVAEDDHVHELFLGAPGGTFIDASDRLPAQSEGNALAVADVNGDGLPDIVIGNSGENRPGKPRMSGQDFLWLNDPKHPGHFLDATRTHMPTDNDNTQDIALVDVDGDGDLDMVIANEDPPSRLLINDGTGHFHDESSRLELRVPMETREVHAFDANGDGKPDLLLLNLTSNNYGWDKDPQARLLINDGEGRFRDETALRLPANRFSTWGGAVVDLNNDGHPDIVLGAVQVPGFVPLQARAYINDGKGQFTDDTLGIMPAMTIGRHWSMAVGDLNGDKKDDIFLGGWGSQARLLLSRVGPGRTEVE